MESRFRMTGTYGSWHGLFFAYVACCCHMIVCMYGCTYAIFEMTYCIFLPPMTALFEKWLLAHTLLPGTTAHSNYIHNQPVCDKEIEVNIIFFSP